MNAYDSLIQDLSGENRAARQRALRQLKSDPPSAARALLSALAPDWPWSPLWNAAQRHWDGPEAFTPEAPEDAAERRLEDALFALGLPALSELQAGLAHPARRARHAAARALARHGEDGIEPLLAALNQPLACVAASGALTAAGEAAVQPLARALRAAAPGSRVWSLADYALSQILGMVSARELRRGRRRLIAAALGGLVAFAFFGGLARWAGLDWPPTLIFGLLFGYGVWAAAITGFDFSHLDSPFDLLLMLAAVFSAPVAQFRAGAELREQLALRRQTLRRLRLSPESHDPLLHRSA